MTHPDTFSTLPTTPALPANVKTLLADAARNRERQLAALPPYEGDLVAEAHRASVVGILGEIRAAIERLDAGTYGNCLRCSEPIPVERLELLLWSPRCVRCAAL